MRAERRRGARRARLVGSAAAPRRRRPAHGRVRGRSAPRAVSWRARPRSAGSSPSRTSRHRHRARDRRRHGAGDIGAAGAGAGRRRRPRRRRLLVDRPGRGAAVVGPDAVELRPSTCPAGSTLHEVDVDLVGARPDHRRGPRRGRLGPAARSSAGSRWPSRSSALRRGRVELAVEHASASRAVRPADRHGSRPCATCWRGPRTDCVAIDGVARQAVALDSAAPHRYGEVVKALAGRNGRARPASGRSRCSAPSASPPSTSTTTSTAGCSRWTSLLGTSAALTHGLGALAAHRRTRTRASRPNCSCPTAR